MVQVVMLLSEPIVKRNDIKTQNNNVYLKSFLSFRYVLMSLLFDNIATHVYLWLTFYNPFKIQKGKYLEKKTALLNEVSSFKTGLRVCTCHLRPRLISAIEIKRDVYKMKSFVALKLHIKTIKFQNNKSVHHNQKLSWMESLMKTNKPISIKMYKLWFVKRNTITDKISLQM